MKFGNLPTNAGGSVVDCVDPGVLGVSLDDWVTVVESVETNALVLKVVVCDVDSVLVTVLTSSVCLVVLSVVLSVVDPGVVDTSCKQASIEYPTFDVPSLLCMLMRNPAANRKCNWI